MTADVRIAVENYEILLAAMNDQTSLVLGRVFGSDTEDTGGI
jgi:hypothetical protein